MGLPTSEKDTPLLGPGYTETVWPAGVANFYKGHIVGVGTDDGMLKHLSASVRPVGVCLETVAVTTAGSRKVKFAEDCIVEFDNSATNTISASLRNKPVYAETTTNTYTVGNASGTGTFQYMGMFDSLSSAGKVRVKMSVHTPISGTIV